MHYTTSVELHQAEMAMEWLSAVSGRLSIACTQHIPKMLIPNSLSC